MIDQSIEILWNIAFWTWVAAWRAVPLMVIVLIVEGVVRRRMAPKFYCLLWMIVLLRLVLPVSATSSLSLHNATQTLSHFDVFFQNEMGCTAAWSDSLDLSSQLEANHKLDSWQPLASQPARSAEPAQLRGAESTSADATLVPILNPLPASTASPGSWLWLDPINLAVVFWALVGSGLLLRVLLSHIRCWRALRKGQEILDATILNELAGACEAVGLWRQPTLREVPGLDVPAVFGVFRPVICLPPECRDLPKREREMVLLHEVAHVVRCDGLVLSLAVAIRAIHWMNPCAWWALAKLRNHMELAADDVVAQHAKDFCGRDYGRLLLHFSSNDCQRQILMPGLAMAAPGKSLAQRIQRINAQRSKHWFVGVSSAIVIAAVAYCGLTDARAGDEQPGLIIERPEVAQFEGVEPIFRAEPAPQTQSEPGPKTTVTYDVANALKKIRQTEPETDARERLVESICPPVTANVKPQIVAHFDDEDRLIVSAPASSQAVVGDYIQLLAESGFWIIDCELHVVTVEVDRLKELGVAWNVAELPEPSPPTEHQLAESLASIDSDSLSVDRRQQVSIARAVVAARITQAQKRHLISLYENRSNATMWSSPRVSLRNGQIASIRDEVMRPFTIGVQQEDSQVRPVVEVFRQGTRIDIRVRVKSDDRLSLQCQLMQSDIQGVQLAQLPIRDEEFTVQVPRAHQDTTTIGASLVDGESILIVSPTPYSATSKQAATARCYLLSPRWTRER